ncbi:MAG: DUF4831 family protein [Alistipes sp.]|nr:DUF4831 family protein [Alistipes sp.]
MKRLLILVAMVVLSMSLYAQNNPYIALLGVFDTADGGVMLSVPTTTLTVDVEAECERTICGPYARYAQKYLGVRAPLTDKNEWRMTRAAVGLADADIYQQEPFDADAPETMSYTTSEVDFPVVLPDKTSTNAATLESAAMAAANAIFSLRRHRTELITGEAGEHVFGEGLEAALNEIARQEQAYLELFLGKRITSRVAYRYVVTPESSRQQYVVCRFSPDQGIVPSSDLTGNMVVLQITPAEQVVSPIPEAGPKETATLTCIIANRATCTVQAQGEELCREVLPIYAFGRTIQVAQPKHR